MRHNGSAVRIEHLAGSAGPIRGDESMQQLDSLGTGKRSAGTFQISPRGFLSRANRSLSRMLGYPSPEAMIAAVVDLQRDLHIDPRRYNEITQALERRGEVENEELELTHKSGHRVTVSLRLAALRDEAGSVLHYEGMAAPVTARPLAEELPGGKNLFRALMDAQAQFIVVLSPNGEVLDINGAALDILGLKFADVKGRSFVAITRPRHSDYLSFLVEEVFAGTSGSARVELQCADGYRLFDASGLPVRNEEGAVASALIVCRDMTMRRRAEDKLADSENRFRTAFGQAPIGMALISPDGHYLRVNRAYCEMLGYTEAELSESTFWDLTHPDDRNAGERASQQFDRGELSILELEKRYKHKLGHDVWGMVKISAVRDAGNHLQYYISQVIDITQKKNTERVLHESEILSALGSLVGSVAHEVRNPLFGISAVLDAFEARYGGEQQFHRYFEALRGELARMNDLMRELLEYGKPIALEREPVSVLEILSASLTACFSHAKKRRVILRTDLKNTPAHSSFDRRRLLLAFRNLIENAIQYSPAGGTVTVEVGEVRDKGGDWIAFNFKDSGPGFSEQDLPRLFEPFFSRRKGGTGLGLAIVKRIVEEHGGTILAANREDGGAVLSLRLPGSTSKESANAKGAGS